MSEGRKSRLPERSKAPVLYLVPQSRASKQPASACEDTVGCLRALLDAAVAGEIVGLAFAAQYTEQRYVVDAAGACGRNRTFTRGMLAELDDKLGGAHA